MSLRFRRPQHAEAQTTCPHRRRFLQYGFAAASSLVIPEALAGAKNTGPADAKALLGERKLSLLNLHTGENLTATYWAEGQYQPAELAAINRVLRDHRTGDIARMDTALLELLNKLHHTMNSKQAFHVISGYRSPKTNAALSKKSSGVAKKSMHMQGRAIDIRLPDCQLSSLRQAALSCQAGGVGYYPKSNFIHVDTGRVRHWG